MAHKGDTQADSDATPKLPNSYQRNGIYYFKRRYPKDIRDAGLIEEEFDTGSLHTRDPKEARIQVDRRNALFSFKVERLRAELEGRDLNGRSKSKREFSAVSGAEQKALILRWFVEQEEAKCASREQFREKDEGEQETILDIALEDLAAYQGSTGIRPFNWANATQQFFQERGILRSAGKIADTVVQLFRRAKTENQWRTVAAYEGNRSTWNDEVFRKLSAHSEMPDAEKAGHTITEICERFPKRKQEGKLSKATLVSYALPLRIIEQLWEGNTPLRSLNFEHGEALIQFLSEIPTNADRKYKGLTLKEAAKMERAKVVPKTNCTLSIPGRTDAPIEILERANSNQRRLPFSAQ
jgi:hypothetical protein